MYGSSHRGGSTHVDIPNQYGQYPPELILRLQRLGRELRLTGQILSTDLDTVRIVEDGVAPAWTTLDGDEVTFSMKHMPNPESRLDVAIWLGTFAHELGHNLFSPRAGSQLMQRVVAADRTFLMGLAQLCNIVEDQRQERLVLAMFGPWRSYLTAALGHHLVADSDSAWLLMCGRTWIDQGLRATARATFAQKWGEATAVEVAEIVGEYQLLTDPGDDEAQDAWELLERLHNIFDTHMPTMPRSCQVLRCGQPNTGQPGESAPATASEADAEVASGDDSGDDSTGDGGDAGDQGEASGEAGGGAGNDPAPPTAREQLRDLRGKLKKAARKELDGDVGGDLDDVLDALDHGRAGDGANGDMPMGQYREVTDAARRLHHDIGDALLDLKDQSEPGWVHRTDSGRLNVRRLASPFADADELFDRYEPGQMDASELEVVLVVDVSGSMMGWVRELAEAVWAIRHAVDDLEGETTVITFDSGPHRILAAAGTRPDDRMFVPTALGGTEPSSAIAEAGRVLSDSQARNRLMVMLTDGQFYGTGSHDWIRSLRDSGVTTVLALLGMGKEDLHGCEFGGIINEPVELALLFRRIAAERIASWR